MIRPSKGLLIDHFSWTQCVGPFTTSLPQSLCADRELLAPVRVGKLTLFSRIAGEIGVLLAIC
jgi:hypothetical protein